MVRISEGLGAILLAFSACSGTTEMKRYSPTVQERQLADITNVVHPAYRLNVRQPDAQGIQNILAVIERVPDPLQQAANEYGGIVVIFDGTITDNESMHSFKGQQIPKWSEGKVYDILPGAYSITFKEALIKRGYTPDSHGSVSLELHEYGHLMDFALGSAVSLPSLSSSPYFISVHEVSKRRTKSDGSRIISDYSYNYRDEFFAEAFAQYYHSPQSRQSLDANTPEAHHFFRNLEIAVSTDSLADFNKFYPGSNQPHPVQNNERPAIESHCIIK